jgi:hypothetical protein
VFDAPATSNSRRKQLIRAVISEIVLTIDRQARTSHALITWQGGATTAVTVALPRRGAGAITTSEDTLELIRRLAACYNDTTIARILGRQHAHRDRAGLDPRPGQQPAPLPRHPALPRTAGNCQCQRR